MIVGSLFAGIGGFDLAAEWMGWRTVWQSEIDPYCVALLARRFPRARQLGDIARVDWRTVERPNVICGGFPCQDISYAGKGAGLSGARSGLWYEYARCVRELGPDYFVVENVRALFTRGFDAVLGTLADLGYDAEWSMYGAADVGAPHRRERVWILAHRNGQLFDGSGPSGPSGWSEPPDGRTDVANAAGERPGETWGLRRNESPEWPSSGGEAIPHGERERLERLIEVGPTPRAADGPGHGRYPGGWDVEPDVGRVAHGVPARVDRLRGLGNAIVPACALPIFRRIEQLEALT
jgi:DNA (cytosine-5)-methyltransferase 1